jgi:hypothetical protein
MRSKWDAAIEWTIDAMCISVVVLVLATLAVVIASGAGLQ